MQYLQWFDDSKKPIEAKIVDAIATYKLRYYEYPTIVLVSEADAAPASVAGVPTRIEKWMRTNNVGVGVEG